MVRTFLSDENVLDLLLGVFLYDLLKNCLEVAERLLAAVLEVIGYKAEDMLPCCLHAAIEVYRCDDSFKRVRKYRGTLSAAGILLSLAEEEEIAEVYLLCEYMQALLANERSSELCEVTLGNACEVLVKIVGYYYREHAVAQKFEPFIAAARKLSLVCI